MSNIIIEGDFEKTVIVETNYSPVQSVNGQVGFVKIDPSGIGLGNVNNTSDLDKPISIATQLALDGKENYLQTGSINQYYRGDKTWQNLTKNSVGLENVDDTSDLDKPISIPVQNYFTSLESGLGDAFDYVVGLINGANNNIGTIQPAIESQSQAIASIIENQDIKFRKPLSSGVDGEYILYPNQLDQRPKTVRCEIENDVDNVLYMHKVSNISSSGFNVSFSDTLTNTGYFLNIQIGK